MTDTHPLARIGKGIFRGVPRPMLALISATLAVVLGFDLILPDFVPLLDEAVLAFLLYGSTATLLSRKSVDGRGATEGVKVGRLVKEAEAAAKRVVALGKALGKAGHQVPGMNGLAAVRERTAEECAELRRLDGVLSRKENDPWQVKRELEKLERSVAEAEAEGDMARAQSLEIAIEGAQMHAQQVVQQTADRDKLVMKLRARTGSLSSLEATLVVLEKRGEVPNLPDGLGDGWEPELAAVVRGLREVAVATAELEALAEPAARPGAQGRSRSSNKA